MDELKAIHSEHKDFPLLLYALPGMSKLEVFKVLPELVSQKKAMVKKALRVLLLPVSAEFAPVSSAELMVQLITLKNLPVKVIKEAIDYCLSLLL